MIHSLHTSLLVRQPLLERTLGNKGYCELKIQTRTKQTEASSSTFGLVVLASRRTSTIVSNKSLALGAQLSPSFSCLLFGSPRHNIDSVNALRYVRLRRGVAWHGWRGACTVTGHRSQPVMIFYAGYRESKMTKENRYILYWIYYISLYIFGLAKVLVG